MTLRRWPLVAAGLGAAVARASYRRVVAGDVVVDLGLGRVVRPLGPLSIAIDAPREIVFDVIAAPYLAGAASSEGITVLERGSDMVLAAHRTSVASDLVATTVETVRFRRPEEVHFRLVRGPVPHVVERFVLHDVDGATRLTYDGELGADLWGLGRWWGDQVARRWEAAVGASFEEVRRHAEDRAARRRRRAPRDTDAT